MNNFFNFVTLSLFILFLMIPSKFLNSNWIKISYLYSTNSPYTQSHLRVHSLLLPFLIITGSYLPLPTFRWLPFLKRGGHIYPVTSIISFINMLLHTPFGGCFRKNQVENWLDSVVTVRYYFYHYLVHLLTNVLITHIRLIRLLYQAILKY